MTNENEYTLLQKTYKRIQNLENIYNPILVCNEDHRFIVAEQMKAINIKPEAILLEPIGKNTAPAIALAALKTLEKSYLIKINGEIVERIQDMIMRVSLGIHKGSSLKDVDHSPSFYPKSSKEKNI